MLGSKVLVSIISAIILSSCTSDEGNLSKSGELLSCGISEKFTPEGAVNLALNMDNFPLPAGKWTPNIGSAERLPVPIPGIIISFDNFSHVTPPPLDQYVLLVTFSSNCNIQNALFSYIDYDTQNYLNSLTYVYTLPCNSESCPSITFDQANGGIIFENSVMYPDTTNSKNQATGSVTVNGSLYF